MVLLTEAVLLAVFGSAASLLIVTAFVTGPRFGRALTAGRRRT
jgi:hypothetical protein